MAKQEIADTPSPSTLEGGTNLFDSIVRSRKTVRAFRSDDVPRPILMDILDAARTAPSTFNTQPWRVYVLTGGVKSALSNRILEAHAANTTAPFSPFPEPAPQEISARQGDFGRIYYGALGIARDDMAARSRQTGHNFEFFGAPIGLLFTIDSALTKHSWLDFGLFLQNLMLAAHVRGIATCPQVSFVRYRTLIADQLAFTAGEELVCGMSLGYADEQAPVNRLNMPREPLENFTQWLGFAD
jgi:nitroreductase